MQYALKLEETMEDQLKKYVQTKDDGSLFTGQNIYNNVATFIFKECQLHAQARTDHACVAFFIGPSSSSRLFAVYPNIPSYIAGRTPSGHPVCHSFDRPTAFKPFPSGPSPLGLGSMSAKDSTRIRKLQSRKDRCFLSSPAKA
jgi:hypothetical protein